MHILLIVTGFPSSGNPANSVFNLIYAEELSKRNCKVSIILVRNIHPLRRLISKRNLYGINLIEISTLLPKKYLLKKNLPVYEIFKSFLYKNKIKRLIQDVDIIHAIHRGTIDFSYLISERFNKPMISQFIGGSLKVDLPTLLKRKYFIRGLQASRYLCFNSKKLEADFLTTAFGAFNTKVLYRGVNINNFPYNFSHSSEIHILFLGGFPSNSNLKGGKTLIDSIKLMESISISNSLKFTIGGPNSFNFQNQLKEFKNPNIQIEFIGEVDKTTARLKMKESHIVIIPSLVEGLPNVLFESMSSGNMVIATSVGGIPEILDDGVTGRLIQPNDPYELMNIIIKHTSCKNEIERYAQNGRKKIQNYDYDIFINSYIRIYKETISNSKKKESE